ncbi:MAG: dihydrolipoyl dehydrogenase [Parachlamydiaceae bacterium]
MKKQKFDVVVIGGGPGGYPAAIRAAQLGKTVALIEANELGGTCLNRGCIPSKALIACAERLKQVKEAAEFGIIVKDISFDYSFMVHRKDQIVTRIKKNLEGLIATNGIKVIKGYGKLLPSKEIEVTGQDSCLLEAEKIIIATGSEPRDIPAFPFDHEKILDSTDLLNLKTLPKKLAIIGGGVIGCEFASLFNTLGVEVAIVEMLPSILPMECESVASYLTKSFKKRGIAIHTNATVDCIEKKADGVKVVGNNLSPIEADLALVAVGRSMNVRNIGLEELGIKIKKNNLIEVNEYMETTVSGIYAIGDLSSTWWLAHVATHQGLVAADHACGRQIRMNYTAVPSVIFTDPEIGTVGLSIKKAKEQGYEISIGQFPFQALGKSQAMNQTEGFAQIIVDKKRGQILGAQVVGHEASALIAELTLAINNELTIECITETIHAHPTIAESWLEAALLAEGHPVHFPPKGR